MLKRNTWMVLGAAVVMASGCDGVNDFSTEAGACYTGKIIDAAFVRSGDFEPGVRLTLELDVDALGEGGREGAWITTSNGLFQRSPVRQMKSLSLDQLSLLSFPSGRIRSYLAYAPDANGAMANVVISLMENGDTEVRIFQPAADPEDSLFGVFRLTRKEGCGTIRETE